MFSSRNLYGFGSFPCLNLDSNIILYQVSWFECVKLLINFLEAFFCSFSIVANVVTCVLILKIHNESKMFNKNVIEMIIQFKVWILKYSLDYNRNWRFLVFYAEFRAFYDNFQVFMVIFVSSRINQNDGRFNFVPITLI